MASTELRSTPWRLGHAPFARLDLLSPNALSGALSADRSMGGRHGMQKDPSGIRTGRLIGNVRQAKRFGREALPLKNLR